VIGSTKGNGFSQHQLDDIALLTCITKLDLSTPAPPITAILYKGMNLLANLAALGVGDATDGDVVDGDVTDGDVVDGDVTDGDVVDGDVTDGDMIDGDMIDGDMIDGDMIDGDMIDGDMIDGDVDGVSIDLPGREKFLAVPGCRSYTRPSDALRTCFGVSRRDSKFSVFRISCGP
jgi:hypothetical protein